MFEDAPCGYICLSPDWRITQVNKTFLGWTGHDHDALYGRAITDILDVAGRIYLSTHFMPIMQLQQALNEVALNFVASDGAPLPVLVNARTQRDAQGEL